MAPHVSKVVSERWFCLWSDAGTISSDGQVDGQATGEFYDVW